MAEDEQKTFMDKSTIYKWLDEIDKANRHSPPVTPAKLRKNLQKRFGKNWNREYSPTGKIGDDLDKLLKMRRARKGGRVGYTLGDQIIPPTSPTGIPGAGGPPTGAAPVTPNKSASVKKQPSKEEQMAKKIDASNKIAAAKAEDAKVAQRKSLGQSLGQPQRKPPGPPGMSQPQAPRAMVRKGGSINPQGYKRGGKVYANICRPANHSEA